jgi:Zn-dependent M28 family amino/carboxypeptidase
VDNGAAVAVLLSLAAHLRHGGLRLQNSDVTLLFSVGEEAMMQGALAYVRDRQGWPLPARAINLEILGQNGGYLLWENDGTAMQQWPSDAELNGALEAAIETVAGEQARRERIANTDAFAFLRQGIPAATLGSYDASLGARGLHSADDNPGRVDAARLVQATKVITHLLSELDRPGGLQ